MGDVCEGSIPLVKDSYDESVGLRPRVLGVVVRKASLRSPELCVPDSPNTVLDCSLWDRVLAQFRKDQCGHCFNVSPG